MSLFCIVVVVVVNFLNFISYIYQSVLMEFLERLLSHHGVDLLMSFSIHDIWRSMSRRVIFFPFGPVGLKLNPWIAYGLKGYEVTLSRGWGPVTYISSLFNMLWTLKIYHGFNNFQRRMNKIEMWYCLILQNRASP